MFTFVLIPYLLAIFFYFIAHAMRTKKWLALYSIFWLTVAGFAIYDSIASNGFKNGDSLGLGQAITTIVISFVCYAAALGIVGRATVLYFRDKRSSISNLMVHLVSLGCFFILPKLIQLILPKLGQAISFLIYFW